MPHTFNVHKTPQTTIMGEQITPPTESQGLAGTQAGPAVAKEEPEKEPLNWYTKEQYSKEDIDKRINDLMIGKGDYYYFKLSNYPGSFDDIKKKYQGDITLERHSIKGEDPDKKYDYVFIRNPNLLEVLEIDKKMPTQQQDTGSKLWNLNKSRIENSPEYLYWLQKGQSKSLPGHKLFDLFLDSQVKPGGYSLEDSGKHNQGNAYDQALSQYKSTISQKQSRPTTLTYPTDVYDPAKWPGGVPAGGTPEKYDPVTQTWASAGWDDPSAHYFGKDFQAPQTTIMGEQVAPPTPTQGMAGTQAGPPTAQKALSPRTTIMGEQVAPPTPTQGMAGTQAGPAAASEISTAEKIKQMALTQGSPTTKTETTIPYASKTLSKTIQNQAIRGSLKKAIPIIGGGFSLWDAVKRAQEGDWIGAGLGAASTIPGIGWGALAGQTALDIKRAKDAAAKDAAARDAAAKDAGVVPFKEQTDAAATDSYRDMLFRNPFEGFGSEPTQQARQDLASGSGLSNIYETQLSNINVPAQTTAGLPVQTTPAAQQRRTITSFLPRQRQPQMMQPQMTQPQITTPTAQAALPHIIPSPTPTTQPAVPTTTQAEKPPASDLVKNLFWNPQTRKYQDTPPTTTQPKPQEKRTTAESSWAVNDEGTRYNIYAGDPNIDQEGGYNFRIKEEDEEWHSYRGDEGYNKRRLIHPKGLAIPAGFKPVGETTSTDGQKLIKYEYDQKDFDWDQFYKDTGTEPHPSHKTMELPLEMNPRWWKTMSEEDVKSMHPRWWDEKNMGLMPMPMGHMGFNSKWTTEQMPDGGYTWVPDWLAFENARRGIFTTDPQLGDVSRFGQQPEWLQYSRSSNAYTPSIEAQLDAAWKGELPEFGEGVGRPYDPSSVEDQQIRASMFEDLIGMNSLQGRDMPPTTQEMMPTNRELLMKQQKGQLPARQDVTWDYDPLYGSEWFPQEMGRPMRPAAQAGLTPRTDMLKRPLFPTQTPQEIAPYKPVSQFYNLQMPSNIERLNPFYQNLLQKGQTYAQQLRPERLPAQLEGLPTFTQTGQTQPEIISRRRGNIRQALSPALRGSRRPFQRYREAMGGLR